MMKLLCMLLAMKHYELSFISLLWRLDLINLICRKVITVLNSSGLEHTTNKP